MKILRSTGQKVLEAPIQAESAYIGFTDKGKLNVTIDLHTVDRNTLYLISFDRTDLTQLREVLETIK